jgi:hypothetical protein
MKIHFDHEKFKVYRLSLELLHQIVSMIVGLIKSNSDRIYETGFEYNSIELKT